MELIFLSVHQYNSSNSKATATQMHNNSTTYEQQHQTAKPERPTTKFSMKHKKAQLTNQEQKNIE